MARCLIKHKDDFIFALQPSLSQTGNAIHTPHSEADITTFSRCLTSRRDNNLQGTHINICLSLGTDYAGN